MLNFSRKVGVSQSVIFPHQERGYFWDRVYPLELTIPDSPDACGYDLLGMLNGVPSKECQGLHLFMVRQAS